MRAICPLKYKKGKATWDNTTKSKKDNNFIYDPAYRKATVAVLCQD